MMPSAAGADAPRAPPAETAAALALVVSALAGLAPMHDE